VALGDSKKTCEIAATTAWPCCSLALKCIPQSVANGNSWKSCGNSRTMPRKWSGTPRARTNFGSFTKPGTLIRLRNGRVQARLQWPGALFWCVTKLLWLFGVRLDKFERKRLALYLDRSRARGLGPDRHRRCLWCAKRPAESHVFSNDESPG